MIKWKSRYVRMAVVLGAIASYAVAGGASMRWF